MISANFRDVERFRDELHDFGFKALPIVERNATNRLAFESMTEARIQVQRKMTLRNSFSVRSVRVNKMTKSNGFAEMGSVAPYMRDQEFGSVETKKGRHGVAIPTRRASGEGDGASPRRRLVRAPNKLPRIKLKRTARKRLTKQQRAIVAVKTARKAGRKFAFIDGNKHKGIVRVYKSKSRRIDMMQDLTSKSVVIPRNPWLGPAVRRALPRGPQIFVEEAEKQIAFQALFRTR